MKKIILITGAILLFLNFIIGIILSSISWLNLVISSLVIIISMALVIFVNNAIVKIGYRISLTLLVPFLGFIEYLGAMLMPNTFKDNWILIGIILLGAFQTFLVIFCFGVSRYIIKT